MPPSVQQYIADQIRALEEAERRSSAKEDERKAIEPFTPRRSRASLGRLFNPRSSIRLEDHPVRWEHARLLRHVAVLRTCPPSSSVIPHIFPF